MASIQLKPAAAPDSRLSHSYAAVANITARSIPGGRRVQDAGAPFVHGAVLLHGGRAAVAARRL